MGQFATLSGMSAALFRAAESFLGHRRGGVAMSAIGACAGFGAICGSSLATAATMGQVALPELRRYGYPGSLATGALAAGGTLGHPDPALGDPGDLRDSGRAEHRKAVRGGPDPRHSRGHRLYDRDFDLGARVAQCRRGQGPRAVVRAAGGALARSGL